MIDPSAARELADVWLAEHEQNGTESPIGRLFATDEVQDVARTATLSRDVVDELIEQGLVVRVGDGIQGTIRLSSWERFVVAHDPSDPLELRTNSVAGINPTTRTLAALTVRRPVDRALDIGTGCGAHALLASRHAREVVATDVNPRALWFTALNAAMNGVTNITCAEGSLFDPVEGTAFDLVVGNLPFVVSPDYSYSFRDSGLPADDISRRAVVGTASILNPGGYASLMCNWVVETGDHWSVRPRSWLSSVACSSWLLYHSSEPSRAYAEKWNRSLLRDRPNDYLDTVERWVEYHERLGAVGIANGAVALHADESRTRRVDDMALQPLGNGGSQVERMFSNARRLDDHDLSQAVISLVSPHGLHQVLRYEDDHYGAGDARLVLEETAGVAGIVAPLATHILLRVDGERTLGEVVERAADDTGLDPKELLEASLATFVDLARQGIIEIHWPD